MEQQVSETPKPQEVLEEPVQNEPAPQNEPQKPETSEKPTNADPAKPDKADEEFDYSKDDGVISPKDKLINFGKGLISPITSMFESPENFAMGAGMIAGSAALIWATGGLAAPVLIGAGILYGAYKFGEGAVNANKAKTDEEAALAWQGMGEGTSFIGMSVLGAKSSPKGPKDIAAKFKNNENPVTPKPKQDNINPKPVETEDVNPVIKEEAKPAEPEKTNPVQKEEVKPAEEPIVEEESVTQKEEAAQKFEITEEKMNELLHYLISGRKKVTPKEEVAPKPEAPVEPKAPIEPKGIAEVEPVKIEEPKTGKTDEIVHNTGKKRKKMLERAQRLSGNVRTEKIQIKEKTVKPEEQTPVEAETPITPEKISEVEPFKPEITETVKSEGTKKNIFRTTDEDLYNNDLINNNIWSHDNGGVKIGQNANGQITWDYTVGEINYKRTYNADYSFTEQETDLLGNIKITNYDKFGYIKNTENQTLTEPIEIIEKPVKPKEEVTPVEAETPVEPETISGTNSEIKPNMPKQLLDLELTAFAENIPNLSRSELANLRCELESKIFKIKISNIHDKEKGLSEIAPFSDKLELVQQRENEIAKALQPFHPGDTLTDNSAITKHHEAFGFNPDIRRAVEARANNMEGLEECEIKEVLSTEELMSKIDKDFEKLSPLNHDCIVYKGATEDTAYVEKNKILEVIDNAKVGDIVVPDTAYTYTAFEYSTAAKWGVNAKIEGNRAMMCEIHLPKGAKVSRNTEHSGEILMPRGAQYKIIDKKVSPNGDIEVVLEYILPKENVPPKAE